MAPAQAVLSVNFTVMPSGSTLVCCHDMVPYL
jgi:hypothetical protein